MKKLLLLITLVFPYNAAAQQDEAEIKKVIENLFTAMQKGDTALARSCFHTEARLQTALYSSKTQRSLLITEHIDKFISQIAKSGNDKMQLEERITSSETRIDLPLASVWATYEFYLNGKLIHTGVDAFQLFKSEEGWKIIQLCDTRKKK